MRHASRPRAARAAVPLLGALALAAALGCKGTDNGGAKGDVGGTLVITSPTDLDVLLPPLVTTVEGKRATDLIFDHLAEIGDSLNTIGDGGFTPVLADHWDWAKDSMSIAFHLNPKARWHDGQPVRAEDVRLTYQLYSDPVVASMAASNVANIDSVSVRDSLTAVVWYKKHTPTEFFDAAYNLSIMPAHLLASVPRAELKASPFLKNPVGTGRFRFSRWVPGQSFEVVADTLNYRGRAKLDRVVVTVSPDFTAAVTKLYAGEADFFENLRADNLTEVAKHPEIVARPRRSFDYGALGFNLRDGASSRPHPLFGDRSLRRALTMALDRQAMARSVMDSLGKAAVGPVSSTVQGTDHITQIPYDTAAAARLLDSLGWKRGADGVRQKNGKPLAFSLVVPTSSKTRSNFAVLVQEQLKRAGVTVALDPVEFNTFVEREKARTFDAVMLGWSTDPNPSSSLEQTWSSKGIGNGGSNYGAYASRAFDAEVDSASTSFDPASATRHFAAAFQQIVDDAPAVWLYEPRPFYGLHKRVRPVGVRADAWWAGLADWTVDPAQRLPRDEIGLRAR